MKYNILVIPDIHLKHNRIQRFLDEHTYTKAIFLGDYFDDFLDTEIENQDTAIWLKSSLYNPLHIHLLGNHDLPYLYNGEKHLCSGFTTTKNKFIHKILTPEDWKRFKTFHLQKINKQPFLFTHAGLSNPCFTTYIQELQYLRNALNSEQYHVVNKKYPQWTPNVGFSRGGNSPRGGIFWCDISEFSPVDRLNQIFGHTPTDNLIPKEVYPGNWAIDTHLISVININRKGKVEIIDLEL